MQTLLHGKWIDNQEVRLDLILLDKTPADAERKSYNGGIVLLGFVTDVLKFRTFC